MRQWTDLPGGGASARICARGRSAVLDPVGARGGGSLAPPEVAVEALFAEADLAARLIADSQPTPFQFDASGALIAGGDPVLLLRTLARARALTLVDAKGKTVGRLSPRGATAALRWMDELQLRAGTTSAVIAIGSRAAPQIGPKLPGIDSPPQSTKPPRQLASSEVAAIRKRYGCGRVADEKVDAHRLDAATSLAIVPCMVHAYQASSIVVLLGESGRWRPVPLERRFADSNPDETPEWMTSPDYDPDTRSLWTDYKGRGLGDAAAARVMCGMDAGSGWRISTRWIVAPVLARESLCGAPPTNPNPEVV